ncbi:hypothetical protein BRYFOR_06991 [Marvinbryantia formatexigens DSM 14469]|uniref:DUF3783 domain-containing protein n=1 Tax=Marvinbryantia formatexigens DSM 14469 TaxID=478749 RepID=C6LEE2_9FIRM|nr:DUF3783 domain-containing protein [Marvinbryantia formatexigens]EET60925.1 hypothetical protein BRYFOR_06991 [Marvinbryantia formatexigens DSM 14469]UWO24778.1 DUF3783 domain-containing protein [Marvinbryantia formatexigens DSM 14469]SDF22974.1 protein of unknown function [Marvinbryantia formatexigens]
MKSIVLCYNLEGTDKGRKLAGIFRLLGCELRHVQKQELLAPIGALAGIFAEDAAKQPYLGSGFPEEMLVLHMAGEEVLDIALQMMRKEQAAVALKAVLTPHNMQWSSLELYEEIRREHAAMAGRRAPEQ